ncbi:MAG TPA: carboxypeptidase regulatory-like domain-containing protein [Candidatus Acidoferrum sp.]|nr:carboxypeptidase regulatory-like domain-containing protein [Candidatus Acidoferrum sp.]
MEVPQVRATLRGILSSLVTLFVLLIAGASSTLAQSTASLSGTVTDSTGAAIPGATVTVKNQATGVESTITTDTAGVYLFPTLSIGTYRLEIKATNFQGVVLTDIQLQVASAQVRDVQMKVGQAAETVEITADAAVVDTTTTSLGQVINNKTVQEIPLNGRHFTDLSLLTTGTVTPPANGFLSAPLRGQGSFGINTAGQREDTTNWLVNGINLNDNVQNQITFQPPIDTLAEYKIDNSSFPAQYGRNAGAIVNLATRSGTNEYHAELFEFFRNNALDARNVFNTRLTSTGAPNPQAPFKRNDFGASGGGPIRKNKVFFFLAYEGLRQHQSLTVASSRVPSQNERAGATSAAIQKILAVIPAANLVGTGNASDPATFNAFTGGTLANVSLNQGSADIDVQLSEKDKIHGYYVVQKDLRQEPTAGGAIGTNLPGFGDTRDGLRHLMTVSEDHVFGPSLTNTVRLGFNRIHLTFTPNQLLDPTDFGINMPAGAPVASGLPFFNVGNALGFGGPTGEPQGRGDTTVVLNDGLSWLSGRHTFMFGGEIRRAYNNNIAFNVGSFTFNATGSGATQQTAMQNFLNDAASAFTVQLGSGNNRILQPSYDAFAQDSFKWKSNFTINAGLRYAWNSSPSEANDHFTQFDPTTGTLVAAGQPYHTNNKNFQPRIGFAWDPFKNGKTSVRAAYAILTQNPTTNIVTGLSGNPPFAVPISVNSGVITVENPAPSTGTFRTSLGPAAINSRFDDMYAQDWNLTIDRQLTSSLGLSVAYVGMKGTHLQLNQNINQPLVTGGTYSSVRPFPTLPSTSAILPAQCSAPHPACTLGNINQVNSGGNSHYNALWVTLNKHFSRGLQVLTSYTYSKSLDYNSLSTGETYILQNAYNPRGDYGPSEFDVRHRFVLSGFYQLPFQANRWVSGWEVGTVVQAQTGNPLNPTTAITTPISLTVRPDLVAPLHVTRDPSAWFGPASQFAAELASPCAGTTCHPGSLSRDAVRGPNFVNADFSVIKNTKLTERTNLQFRTEMFDVFNHPNFGNPGLTFTPTSTTFGKVTSTRFPTGDFGSSREIQFALKLQF